MVLEMFQDFPFSAKVDINRLEHFSDPDKLPLHSFFLLNIFIEHLTQLFDNKLRKYKAFTLLFDNKLQEYNAYYL